MCIRDRSVIGAWFPGAKSYELQGSDTLRAYRDILASARYVNKGRVEFLTNQLPFTTELVFTPGDRTFRFEIQDSGGATTTAKSTVSVSAVDRVGVPSRDENLRSPKECSGHGRRDRFDELGTGDPETCICDLGHAGDLCEIHPCNYRGTLAAIDENGVMTCSCEPEFSGNTCQIACGGNGEYDVDTERCACFPGYTGRYCDVRCPGCDGPHGTCSLTPISEDSWREDTRSYGVVETTCACEEWWMGANCTIPCPCARGGFARGTCGVDAEKQAMGTVADEDLGVCVCQPGYVGKDCTISCPPCAANNGDCVPPPGLEDGIGETLNFILVDSTLGTDEVRQAALEATYAKGTGLCECRVGQSNYLGGLGFTGDDCSVACYPCEIGRGGASVCLSVCILITRFI